MTFRLGWRRLSASLASLAAAVCAMLMVAVPCASASETTSTYTHWSIEARPAPTTLVVGSEDLMVVAVANDGDQNSSGQLTVTDRLPQGVKARVAKYEPKGYHFPIDKQPPPGETNCTVAAGGEEVKCTYSEPVRPYEELLIRIELTVEASATTQPDDLEPLDENIVEASGGGVSETLSRSVKASAEPEKLPFGPSQFELIPENEEFKPDTKAGAHPFQLTTVFNLNDGYAVGPNGQAVPTADGLAENLKFELPAGMIGNVNAVEECTAGEFGENLGGEGTGVNDCQSDTQVGVATIAFNANEELLGYDVYTVPVYNLVPEPGEPAQFGFLIHNVPVTLHTAVRTGDGYGVNVSVDVSSDNVEILSSRVTFWGTPADVRHDPERGWTCLEDGTEQYQQDNPCEPNEQPEQQPIAFLTQPTACGAVESDVSGNAWKGSVGTEVNEEGRVVERPTTLTGPEGRTDTPNESPVDLTECGGLEFDPSLSIATDAHEASTPTGMEVDVSLPQVGLEEPGDRVEQDISGTKLELPGGLMSSPAAATAFGSAGTCSIEEVNGVEERPKEGSDNAFDEGELAEQSFDALIPECTEHSTLGEVTIETPVLARPLKGRLYLADQDTNPFKSPLVLYLVAEEERLPGEEKTSVLVKLAGEVQLGENGQLTSVFRETPETPFTRLAIKLTGGERASQSTPAHCGSYEAAAHFLTSSGAQVELGKHNPNNHGFTITSGSGGTPCPESQLPFSPGVTPGSTNPQAGAFSPFTLTVEKPDGQQALESIDVTLPPGLAAKISEVTPCENPNHVLENLSTPSTTPPPCGPENEVGETVSYSGLGGEPVELKGKLYLTRNVDGAPFGLLAVTKAEAGPFDLGYVNVLSTITVNETTAAVTTKTVNPIPTFLDGVPSQLKKISIYVNREHFEFNPTNCGELFVEGALGSSEGASQPFKKPFFASNCGALPFKPKLTATVVGQGSKADGTTFGVTIESEGIGQENIHKVDLTIPAKLPSRNSTIQKACLEKIFNEAPTKCSEESIIGKATVSTPVFKEPLKGEAYLVAHGGAEFPDVEFVLYGEDGVKIVLDGKTQIKNGITYSKFETSPDAPFTKFETVFPAGPHGIFTPYVPEDENFNLCKTTLTMPTEITGQNGDFISKTTPIEVTGCAHVKGFKAKKLTRAQKLKKALASCRKKYKHKKHKRVVCEAKAHKQYGPIKKHKKSAKHSSKKK